MTLTVSLCLIIVVKYQTIALLVSVIGVKNKNVMMGVLKVCSSVLNRNACVIYKQHRIVTDPRQEIINKGDVK
jgi:hypothetical protein